MNDRATKFFLLVLGFVAGTLFGVIVVPFSVRHRDPPPVELPTANDGWIRNDHLHVRTKDADGIKRDYYLETGYGLDGLVHWRQGGLMTNELDTTNNLEDAVTQTNQQTK